MSDTIPILFIEDDPEMCRIVQSLLDKASNGFVVECVSTLKDGLNRLADGGVRCVLLDLGLPDSKGLQSLSMVIAHYPWLPIIVISATDSIDTAESCVAHGAQDYLVKSRIPTHLAWSIRLALARHSARLGNGVPDKLNRTIERLRQRVHSTEVPLLPMLKEQG